MLVLTHVPLPCFPSKTILIPSLSGIPHMEPLPYFTGYQVRPNLGFVSLQVQLKVDLGPA